jgi:hypothetical protein
MTLHKIPVILISLLAVTITARIAHADDTCSTFFWTGAAQGNVERYMPRYLIGEGLEDVGLERIGGTLIHHRWSTQAATCFASDNRNSYFMHPDFGQTSCRATERCFPGKRSRRMSERLADVLDVVGQLGVANADPTYQGNLNQAKTATYVFVDAMNNLRIAVADIYARLAGEYSNMITKINAALNPALPRSVRMTILDEICAPASIEVEEADRDRCVGLGEDCELPSLLAVNNICTDRQNGASLETLVGRLADARSGLVAERGALVSERDAILSLWGQIQGHR